jgi:hypothetical protein
MGTTGRWAAVTCSACAARSPVTTTPRSTSTDRDPASGRRPRLRAHHRREELESSLPSVALLDQWKHIVSITGAPPFVHRTMASVYARLLNDPPPLASQVLRRPVPRAVDDVLVRALAKDRAARYPSARAQGEALASIADDASGAAVRATERMTS